MTEPEKLARSVAKAVRDTPRPCGVCDAETVTVRDGAIVLVKVIHDDDCPWMKNRP